MTPGLLALVLSAYPVGAPPEDVTTPADEIRRRLAERGVGTGYNPRTPDVSGRTTVVGGEGPGLVVAGPVPRCVPPGTGLVYEPAYCLEKHFHGTAEPYLPQAADLVFFVSDTLLWPALYALAFTGEPYHIGTVVQMPDGSFAVLEAGPPEVAQTVQLSPLPQRLEEYSGRIFIRRRAAALTPEQSEALTGFAGRQEGKPYAFVRFLLQGTPVRSRGPLRTEYLGKSRGEPSTYFCSELAMEALVAAGLVDAGIARPRATNMQDMFYDQSENLYIDRTLRLYPCWTPPQQWVPAGCAGTGRASYEP
ncbi:MAG TPA: hypothetical protein VKD90_09120 [Gemmataceae bacterium]|nr:hypothetical protein [Gemmataceae bacterium]